jgi:hypothetical protein
MAIKHAPANCQKPPEHVQSQKMTQSIGSGKKARLAGIQGRTTGKKTFEGNGATWCIRDGEPWLMSYCWRNLNYTRFMWGTRPEATDQKGIFDQ